MLRKGLILLMFFGIGALDLIAQDRTPTPTSDQKVQEVLASCVSNSADCNKELSKIISLAKSEEEIASISASLLSRLVEVANKSKNFDSLLGAGNAFLATISSSNIGESVKVDQLLIVIKSYADVTGVPPKYETEFYRLVTETTLRLVAIVSAPDWSKNGSVHILGDSPAGKNSQAGSKTAEQIANMVFGWFRSAPQLGPQITSNICDGVSKVAGAGAFIEKCRVGARSAIINRDAVAPEGPVPTSTPTPRPCICKRTEDPGHALLMCKLDTAVPTYKGDFDKCEAKGTSITRFICDANQQNYHAETKPCPSRCRPSKSGLGDVCPEPTACSKPSAVLFGKIVCGPDPEFVPEPIG